MLAPQPQLVTGGTGGGAGGAGGAIGGAGAGTGAGVAAAGAAMMAAGTGMMMMNPTMALFPIMLAGASFAKVTQTHFNQFPILHQSFRAISLLICWDMLRGELDFFILDIFREQDTTDILSSPITRPLLTRNTTTCIKIIIMNNKHISLQVSPGCIS